LGDAAHQAEASDHNPDSRGIVHAIDVMFAAGTPQANATLAWLLSDTVDLQYVIHNRRIYTRAANFAPAPYTGSDPHTNHIHVSGKHGTVGKNASTGTGYDTAAEAYHPVGSPLKKAPAPAPKPPVPVTADTKDFDVATVSEVVGALLGTKLGSSGPTVAVALQSGFGYAKNASDKANDLELKVDALKAEL